MERWNRGIRRPATEVFADLLEPGANGTCVLGRILETAEQFSGDPEHDTDVKILRAFLAGLGAA